MNTSFAVDLLDYLAGICLMIRFSNTPATEVIAPPLNAASTVA